MTLVSTISTIRATLGGRKMSNREKWFWRILLLAIIIGILSLRVPVGAIGIYEDVKLDCTLETFMVNGIAFEWTQAKGATPEYVVLQLHGGGYSQSLTYIGGVYRKVAQEFVERCGSSVGVLTPDYRVAPKDPYPAPFEDCVMAYVWLLEQGYNPNKIVFAGESAGGGLTLAVALYLRDNNLPLPAGLVAMSPWGSMEPSIMANQYIGNATNLKDPYLSPYYGDFRNLPPILLQWSKGEMMEEDALELAAKFTKQGIEATMTEYIGHLHSFQVVAPKGTASKKAWDEIEAFVKQCFDESTETDDVIFDSSILASHYSEYHILNSDVSSFPEKPSFLDKVNYWVSYIYTRVTFFFGY